MYMKSKILIILASIFFSTMAFSCAVPKIVDDGSVKLYQDKDKSSGMYHVRVPDKYEGAKLENILLSVKLTTVSGEIELGFHLDIKSNERETGSFFYMSKEWAELEVSATYEGKQCTQLVARLNM